MGASVRDLLRITNFGALSLFDLLVGVEAGLSAGIFTMELDDGGELATALTGAAANRTLTESDAHDIVETCTPATPVHEDHPRTIEDEAGAVLSGALGQQESRWWEPISRRFGLHGGPIPTLEEAGQLIGVTRERVRQVQAKTSARLPTGPLQAPALDQALELMHVVLPCTPADLGDLLRAAGLTAVNEWHAEALNAVGRMTGRSVGLVEANGLIGMPGDIGTVTSLISAAKSISNATGIASVKAIAAKVSQTRPEADLSLGAIYAALESAGGVHWLDPTHCWLDHAPGRNRLVNTCLRILAVISPQTLSDLQDGVARHFSFRAASSGGRLAGLAAPEADLLRRFLVDHPAFNLLDDDHVTAAEPLALEELGDEKQALVAVLKAQPYQAMDRLSLLAACEEIGLNLASVALWITYDESLKRFAPNVWGLRGAVVPPEAIAAIQDEAKRASGSYDRTKLIGVTPSGRPWMARKLTPTILYSGVIPFDWGRNNLAEMSLTIVDMLSGEHLGRIRFSNDFNWGYGTFLRRNGAKVGDVLRAVADLNDECCYLELGGDELLSEPFDL